MAYTIQFLGRSIGKQDKVLSYLQARLAKDGRFRCNLICSNVPTTLSDRLYMVEYFGPALSKTIRQVPAILVSNVRLIKAKSYCGNHPGPCPITDQRKPVSTRLEWDDWVAFHNIVNRVLNRFRIHANVWSLPYDVRGRMWIRKGLKARKRFDWDEKTDILGRVIRLWNPGTPDQFQ